MQYNVPKGSLNNELSHISIDFTSLVVLIGRII